MASDIKDISDAVISRLKNQVSSLNSRTVGIFGGSIAEFAEKTVKNLPFVGVRVKAVDYEEYASDNSTCEEHLKIELLIIIKDLRNQSFGKKAGYDLIDDIRDALLGQTLGLSGLNPIQIQGFEDSEDLEELNWYGFTGNISTFQMRG